jgi:flavodoxin
MKSIVVYASRKGNTRSVAEEIGRALGEIGQVDLFEADGAPDRLPDADIIFVGGPTEGHSATPAIISFLDRLSPDSTAGRKAAAFDTRLAWPRVLSGSAAEVIAQRLTSAGAKLAVLPESFIVTMKPELQPGELKRAGKWALDVARKINAGAAQVAG